MIMTNQARNRSVLTATRKRSTPKAPSHHTAVVTVLGLIWKGLLIAGLFASILFAHGCHGNEDHELLGTWMEWIGN
jgi:hypothetical protein